MLDAAGSDGPRVAPGRPFPGRHALSRAILLAIVLVLVGVFFTTPRRKALPVMQMELVNSGICGETERPAQLDCAFRTGSPSTLSFAIDGTSYSDLSAEATLENGSKSPVEIRPSWWSGASIDLRDFDHRQIILRVFSDSGRPIRWRRAELRGHSEQVPAPLASLLAKRPHKPNILLYVVDTLRSSRMSLYGYGRRTTPHIEEWARRGLVFDNAYSNGADTRGGIPALLASGTPDQLRGHMKMVHGRPSATIGELLQRHGYRTGGFQANVTMMRSLGFSRGFHHYEVLTTYDGEERVKTPATKLHEAAFEWIQKDQRFPFFAYVQTMDVHNPYDAPPPFRDSYFKGPTDRPLPDVSDLSPEEGQRILDVYAELEPDRYDECVAYADAMLNDFLNQLEEAGFLGNTVIILTSDHGESLGQGARYPHGGSLNEEIIQIPLIILMPWAVWHRRDPTVVSLVDLAPTIADLVGMRAPRDHVGHSIFRPRTRHRPPFAFGARNLNGEPVEWFLREGPWKLSLGPLGRRLFLISGDRLGTTDVSAEFPYQAEYMNRRLVATAGRASSRRPDKKGIGLSDHQMREIEEAMRALGYE